MNDTELQIPILTYHSMNITGTSYQHNDHVALFNDIRLIHDEGFRVISLHQIVDALYSHSIRELRRCVALTFDDGALFDYLDLEHPTCGIQRSFFNILYDFIGEYGENSQPNLHATCFVIASPKARDELDRTCMIGNSWWGDDWWNDAVDSNLLSIENHSWDHNHDTLETVSQHKRDRGGFKMVDNLDDADRQIRQAGDYINQQLLTTSSSLFAYPYGEYNDYLVNEYFPRYQLHHQIKAAFTCDGTYLTERSNRWTIPRFVCGHDWKNSDQLREILIGTGKIQ